MPGDETAASCRASDSERFGDSSIFLTQRDEPGVRRIGADDFRGRVGRSVIDDHDLEIDAGLSGDAVERLAQVSGAVVNRDHDRYRRSAHDHNATRQKGSQLSTLSNSALLISSAVDP